METRDSATTLNSVFTDIANAIRQKSSLQGTLTPREMSDAILNIKATTPLVSATPSSSFQIDPYKMYDFGTLSISMSVTFNSSLVQSGMCAEYGFRFVAGSGAVISLPSGCKYLDGKSQFEFVSGRTYEFSIVDNLVVVGEFYN